MASSDQLAFVMRANPRQQKALKRLQDHTGIAVRTRAVWRAVERYPDLQDELRQAREDLHGLRLLLAAVARAAEHEDLAREARGRALDAIREAAGALPAVDGAFRVGHQGARDPLVHLDQ